MIHHFPLQVSTKDMLWDQKPLKSFFFSVESKRAPCVVHCERYIGKMSTVMDDKKVREERERSIADFDKKKYEDM